MARDFDRETVGFIQRTVRDFAAVAVGVFMLVWQTVFTTTPNPLLIGAGLVLLGLPPALRVDQFISRENGEGGKKK